MTGHVFSACVSFNQDHVHFICLEVHKPTAKMRQFLATILIILHWHFCLKQCTGNPVPVTHVPPLGVPDDDAMDGSRGIGFNLKKKTSTTPHPIWRPAVPSKLLLEEEKGLNEIPSDDEDPEFKYLWPDDYYDNYAFESKKSMLQHGTFESKMQNYHEAEFTEALAKLKEKNEMDKNVDSLN